MTLMYVGLVPRHPLSYVSAAVLCWDAARLWPAYVSQQMLSCPAALIHMI